MASLTAGTFLMKGVTSGGTTTYTKYIDISEYPDIGSTVGTQDVTSLTDACHKYIEALPDPGGSMTFNGFLNDTDYASVQTDAGTEMPLAIAFGGAIDVNDPTKWAPEALSVSGGSVTKGANTFLVVFFTGKVRVRLTGAGTDAARPVEYTVTFTSGITDHNGDML